LGAKELSEFSEFTLTAGVPPIDMVAGDGKRLPDCGLPLFETAVRVDDRDRPAKDECPFGRIASPLGLRRSNDQAGLVAPLFLRLIKNVRCLANASSSVSRRNRS
jgi:hypothetical protein